MIENPIFVSKTGTECPIFLGINVNAFDHDYKLGMKVNREGVTSLKWTTNNESIEYKSPNGIDRISAYPTPDMKNMVIIKLGENSGAPNNSIILDERGEELCLPTIPKRLSKEQHLPKGDLDCFIQSGWCDLEDHIFFFLSIADTGWIETRYFNYKLMTWNTKRYETWRL